MTDPDTPAQASELTIIVPCYNEEASLPQVIPDIIRYCEDHNWKLIIVNDGSRDGTAAIIQEFAGHPRVDIATHKVNRGYGAALATGLRLSQSEYSVTIDADGQHSLEDIPALLETMKKENADLVIGRRVYDSNVVTYRSIGKWIIRRIAKNLFPKMAIKDLNSGFKLYKTRIAKLFTPYCPSSMAFSDFISLLHVNFDYLVVEHPIRVKERIGGSSTISYKTAFETVQEILNLLILFKPLRFFVPLAGIVVIPGIIWGSWLMLLGRGLSVASLLLIVTSLLMFSTGLLAEQGAVRIRAEIERMIDDL